MEEVRIGCSGWSYRDWRGSFYPPGTPSSRWLSHYATVFDTVEINATFYRLPAKTTVHEWAEQVPAGFRFAVKGSRYLTHMRRLRDMKTGLARFWERIEPLREAGKLGPVLWQLPERFERDDEVLAGAVASLPAADHCFEFRHPSWFVPGVYALLEEHGASLALGDDPPQPAQRLAGWPDRLPATALRIAGAGRQLLRTRARHLAATDRCLAIEAQGFRLPEQRLAGLCAAQRNGASLRPLLEPLSK